MNKSIIALALAGTLALTACGQETVYVVTDTAPTETDAPDRTAKRATTTEAQRPSASYDSASPSGSYDPQGYDDWLATEARDLWLIVDSQELLNTGLMVCDLLDSGYTLEEINQTTIDAILGSGSMYLFEEMAVMIAAAIIFLCPEHQWRINALD